MVTTSECTNTNTESVHVNHVIVTKDILTNTVNTPAYRVTVSEHTYTGTVSVYVNPISIMTYTHQDRHCMCLHGKHQ